MKTKSERLFDMARYIGRNGGIGWRKLDSRFSDLSERGIFRYLNTLLEAGVVTRSKASNKGRAGLGARYALKDSWAALFEEVRRGDALEALLIAGIKACEDEEVLEKARQATKEWRHGSIHAVGVQKHRRSGR